MVAFGEEQLAEMQQALARTRAMADRTRQRAAQIRFTARDKERLLTVTVGGHGEVLDLTFHGDGYRGLAPAELSALIVRTIATARTGAARRAMAGMQELLGELPDPGDTARSATSVEELVDSLAEWVSGRAPRPPAAPGEPR
jgi:DNA-binding protein YbaB